MKQAKATEGESVFESKEGLAFLPPPSLAERGANFRFWGVGIWSSAARSSVLSFSLSFSLACTPKISPLCSACDLRERGSKEKKKGMGLEKQQRSSSNNHPLAADASNFPPSVEAIIRTEREESPHIQTGVKTHANARSQRWSQRVFVVPLPTERFPDDFAENLFMVHCPEPMIGSKLAA